MELSADQMAKLNANPLYKTIGIQVLSAGDGQAVSELKPLENVCWPFPGQPHGGILFTQMDTTMAWAVLSLARKEDNTNCSTINLEIQYPAPARGGFFSCQTRVYHSTGRSCFVRGEIHDKDGKLVAMGQATFRIIRVAPIL